MVGNGRPYNRKLEMNRTGIPYLDFTWNPCGCGCSKGCDGCWAKIKVAPRMGCDDCKNFKVHFHPERLNQPLQRKKPAVVGVQFTGELFDPQRSDREISDVLDAASAAPQHTYVFLTQQPHWMKNYFLNYYKQMLPKNWWLGVTVKNQEQMDELSGVIEEFPTGNIWLSIEPIQELMTLDVLGIHRNTPCVFSFGRVSAGVVVGCDNRPCRSDGSFTGRMDTQELVWVERILEECKGLSVKIFVKQLHIGTHCETHVEKFPEKFRVRDLPWKLKTK